MEDGPERFDISGSGDDPAARAQTNFGLILELHNKAPSVHLNQISSCIVRVRKSHVCASVCLCLSMFTVYLL